MLQYWSTITNRSSIASYLEEWYLIELQYFNGWFPFSDSHGPLFYRQKEETSILGYKFLCIFCNGIHFLSHSPPLYLPRWMLLFSQHELFWYELHFSNMLSVTLNLKDRYTLGTTAVQRLILISGVHRPPLLHFTHHKGGGLKAILFHLGTLQCWYIMFNLHSVSSH